MKFGGASVADGERISHVAGLIEKFSSEGHQIAVVTSAMRGITDLLLETAHKAAETGDVSMVKEVTADLTKHHHTAARQAINDKKVLEDVNSELDTRLDELEKAFIGICYLGECTSRSTDLISSYGERLAAPILSGALQAKGVPSTFLTGGQAGIITTDNHGNALPLGYTYKLVKDRLNPLLEGQIPVVTGFIAENEKGTITTLGRGGSDFTASILGAALNVDEIWLWKEVPGIMTTDPGIVPQARTIPVISYIEAMELSYFGAKVLHPRAIEPAIRHGIPVRVKNTFEPEFPGTLVVEEARETESVVKAVTLVQRVALVNISGAGMIGTIGVAARAFTALARAGVNIIMISQGSSEANLSLVVEEQHLDTAVRAIKEEFKNSIVRDVTADRDISVVAVVGAGMAGTPGVAGRVFNALGRAGVNVIMISQGSSQHNISFAVKADMDKKALHILHREFQLDKTTKNN